MKFGTPAVRGLILGSAFVATLAAAVLAPDRDAAVSAPAERARPAQAAQLQRDQPSASNRSEAIPVAVFRRQIDSKVSVVDLFEARNPPSVAPKEIKPEAPKLPFTYVGRVEEDAGTPKVVIMHAGQVHVVQAGDKLAGNTYRLEEISKDKLVFSYLPLAAKQELATGEMK